MAELLGRSSFGAAKRGETGKVERRKRKAAPHRGVPALTDEEINGWCMTFENRRVVFDTSNACQVLPCASDPPNQAMQELFLNIPLRQLGKHWPSCELVLVSRSSIASGPSVAGTGCNPSAWSSPSLFFEDSDLEADLSHPPRPKGPSVPWLSLRWPKPTFSSVVMRTCLVLPPGRLSPSSDRRNGWES